MMFSVFWLIVDNAFVYLIMILVEMWRKSYDQFIKKCTDTIDVRSSIMSLPKQYLRAHVLRRSTKRMGPLFHSYDLRKTKVCDFNMAIDVDQYILRFDITINNVHVMKVFKSEEQLSKVKSSLVLSELLHLAEVEEHLSTGTEIHDKEQLSLRLK